MQNNLTNEDIWLVGAGYMAREYAKVLKGQGKSFNVIGRGVNSAEDFEEMFSIPVFVGGIEDVLNLKVEPPKFAIIAVGVEELSSTCLKLIEFGVENILIEKPAGLNSMEIKEIYNKARDKNIRVFVAYNRRFYSSTLKAQEIIRLDGGVTSFSFEFTEWSHKIRNMNKPKKVFDAWFIANSTHVIDLAFFLGGNPKKMACYTQGTMDWYSKASIFSGAGITHNNALFSYQANWESPGRWGLELSTKKHRLILRPMEELRIQDIGSIEINTVNIFDNLDHKYKPGLYLQVDAFLKQENDKLLNIEEHYNKILIYEHIEEGINFKFD